MNVKLKKRAVVLKAYEIEATSDVGLYLIPTATKGKFFVSLCPLHPTSKIYHDLEYADTISDALDTFKKRVNQYANIGDSNACEKGFYSERIW